MDTLSMIIIKKFKNILVEGDQINKNSTQSQRQRLKIQTNKTSQQGEAGIVQRDGGYSLKSRRGHRTGSTVITTLLQRR